MLPIDIILIIIYSIIVIAIGYFCLSGETLNEFLIGNRKMSKFSTVMTLFATLVTESMFFFGVALTVAYGPLGGLAAIMGSVVGLIVMSFIASKARESGSKNNYMCISDYCRKEWGGFSGRFAKIALLIFLAWVIILQINMNGILFKGILHWSAFASTALTVLIVLAYILMGGYRAVVKTDIFQGILLFITILLPFFIFPKPNILSSLNFKFVSFNMLLLFLMSFSLTITRPEIWERIYSSSSGKVAAKGLRITALLYFLLACFIFYYSLAVVQASPGLSPTDAFAQGYKNILPPIIAAFFPVILLAAMMSSLDSATFLLAVDLSSLRKSFMKRRVLWTRIFTAALLIGGGIISLTVYDTLTFAYTINGFAALIFLPLFLSFFISIPKKILGISISVGLVIYLIQIFMGRIAINQAEAIYPALITGIVLLIGVALTKLKNKSSVKNRSFT
ncbi:MAG: hypothetical protein PHD81_04940 [Candidatus Nanoarchaeia archaeon]|nr:hypothetical protein [Candidatus Nanoarchaeia archaeon]MDD5588424.1 hypothetical protein [Candidatus Nanoarchaeia archaeon]